jgi:hypothetical protein
MPSDRLTDDVGPTLEDELDRLEEENEQLRKEVEWLRGEDRQMRQALDDIVEMCKGHPGREVIKRIAVNARLSSDGVLPCLTD